ncbi:L-ascorbate oxidase [Prunus yedoensis var. nudiflora]|uniref:L-ascorbate oxidase n=1 Tax=Prunus yedoensis var. nudiflora TaxID=2094558 RepID=A0A314YZZ5_PRUYE|nr:L-ascorbate oxidase [Prunus yedoensis var. nudiflora]
MLFVQASSSFLRWEVKYEYKSPDCFKKLVITINGGTPGPKILAQQGDTIVVELKNSLLTENVAIHWHGIRQIGTPWSDGTEGVTQCPILPGDTFIYKFVVDRAGSYLYHAHYGIQREAGLYGSITVSVPNGESEPFAYDYDIGIILNDWFHKSTYEQAAGLSSIPFVWVGEPQSLLINGRGRFNCSLLATPSLEAGGHNMTVVEVDGHYVEPFETKNLYIYSGETYSVLVKASQDPSRNYWVTTNVVSRKPTTPTGLAILNYYPKYFKKSPPTLPTAGPLWNDTAPRLTQSLAVKAHKSFIHSPPLTSDKVIVLLNTQN